MSERQQQEQAAPASVAPTRENFVPPIDLAQIADEFGMRRAAAYLRAMGNQDPVRDARSAADILAD
jgi:hypothetical protein